jgi:hypothetical protein
MTPVSSSLGQSRRFWPIGAESALVLAYAGQVETRCGSAMDSIVPCWSISVARPAFTGRLK